MTTAVALSIAFCNVRCHHMTADSTKFGGDGVIKYVYYFILVTHIVLSIIIIPLVLIMCALAQVFDKHKKIARITFPIWLYVAVTGVVVYLMISPYYVR
jgi:putative membrane protein